MAAFCSQSSRSAAMNQDYPATSEPRMTTKPSIALDYRINWNCPKSKIYPLKGRPYAGTAVTITLGA